MRKPTLVSILLVLLLLGIVGLNGGQPPPKKPQEKKPVIEKIEIAGETFKLEVACDTKSRTRGLMGRKKLDDDGGMIFIFRDRRLRSFWMANCLIDIDILFLDETGRIVAKHAMKAEPPRGERERLWQYERRLKRYSSRKRAQFAIEFKAESIKRLKLKVGDVIEMDRERLKKMAK